MQTLPPLRAGARWHDTRLGLIVDGVLRAWLESACEVRPYTSPTMLVNYSSINSSQPLRCLQSTLSLVSVADRRDATTLMGALLALTWQSEPQRLAPVLRLASPDIESLISAIQKR